MASPKKKKFGDARADYGTEQDGQPFGTYDDDVFAALDAGQVEADTLPIMSIWADKTQPRNIIPRDIHGGWNGDPAAMPDILGTWLEAIYDTGADLPIEDILLGKSRGSDKANSLSSDDPLVAKFLPILSLAAQIRDVGLQQRIGVIGIGKEYRIIYGERRWTAFHLLKMFVGDKYSSIPAKIANISEWELAKIQAAENFHQNPLTAIGKARQLAKLLILARKDQQHPPYDSWEALVVDGGCNRPYFAQVADGNIHRIPKGMGEEFERTLNISVEQMRQYRALLRLTGDYDIDNQLWDLGDERDWAEQFMRQIPQYLDLSIIREILQESEDPEEMLRESIAAAKATKAEDKKALDTVTTVTVSEDLTPKEAMPKSPFSTGTATPFKYSDEVITPDGKGRVIEVRDNTCLVRLDSGKTQRYGVGQLSPANKVESWFDRYVQNVAGKVAQVIADFGEDCEIEYADGGRSRVLKMYLSPVEKSEYNAALQRHREQQPPVNLINFVNKIVHTFQGVARVARNHDAHYVEVEFPDGDKLTIAKKDLTIIDQRHWDEAVETLRVKREKWEGSTGEKKLSLKDVSHRITEKIHILDERAFSDPQMYQKNAWPDGMRWFTLYHRITTIHGLGQHIVIFRVGEHGWAAFFGDARKLANALATAKYPHLKSVHDPFYKDIHICYFNALLSTVWELLPKLGAHYIVATELPKYVSDRDEMRGLVAEWVEAQGLDNANSLPPANSAPDASETKPRDWVGKPALWNEGKGYKVPVFVQEFLGAGMLKVASTGGQVHEVHFSQLEAVETGGTTLSDFMNDNPDHDHSDLKGRRVLLTTGEVGTITEVNGKKLVMQFSEFITGGALVEHIVEVLDDDAAEETKAITNDEKITFLRQLGHLTRRDNTILKLLGLTHQNAIEAHKAGQLVEDLSLIRQSVEQGLQELLEEFVGILEVLIEEIDESVND